MKIQFNDNSYIDAKKTDDGHILIVIQAKDHNNPLKKITNAVELTFEEFLQMISDVKN